MREHISCTTIRAIMIGISDQINLSPYWAPAREYVVMPPASLSTLEVMIPGPMRMKKRPRFFQRGLLGLVIHFQ